MQLQQQGCVSTPRNKKNDTAVGDLQMFMEYVLFFYMLGLGLVAYIFHEMDERSKEVPRTKVEHNKEQWEHDPKEK